MKPLTEKQIHNKLNRYYKKHFEELDTDEWYVNPAPNKWKFIRDGQIITITYNQETETITHTIKKQ